LRGRAAARPWGVGAHRVALLPPVFLLCALVSTAGAAQAPAYTVATIGCARFSETMRATLQSSVGSVRRAEALGRDDVLVLRTERDSGGLSVEAWFDSLAVFREGPEGRFTPDAAGILGGRYRGTLDSRGDYRAEVAPFVPTALREVFDFGRLLRHFFPPLSPVPLAPGGEWADDAGLTIWRLSDSASTTGLVSRYRWIRRESWDEGVAAGDSTLVVHRNEVEDGHLRWRGGEGPLGWNSATVAKLEFTNGTGQTALTQQILVRREPDACR